ncbi:protein kinase domain-containing protein [Engelhardtia mirabilis]|uniref:Serine/threonine-protein kinase PrkC n=1 Tax=Engelhardtia mirabilis TaxID=2528011 RepID=A0A518BLK1_9BACT|nr:Serine/threonine-protein kinase PrkC [Planctomycetes bacterium Pla133]QDV02177.1 Serine/threonine-protein kinase PrkC [Planctomycetes bacterium Pla86]
MTTTESFDLKPGRVLGNSYVIADRLGGGWEGEVYRVVDRRTGAHRAAKLFYPARNERDRAITRYALKLERLRHVPMVVQYHHTETLRWRGQHITALVSELVEGRILSAFVAEQPKQRLGTFEALALLHELACGLEAMHSADVYHGDLHDQNVIVRRRGMRFEVKVLDLFHWGGYGLATSKRDDVIDLTRLLLDLVGGVKAYKHQPQVVKDIVRGQRRQLVSQRFPTVRHLRNHLETVEW